MVSVANTDRRILVVDDDPNALDIIAEALGWEGYQVRKTLIAQETAQIVKDWRPHLIILDVNTPGGDWLDSLKKLRQQEEYVAMLFISADQSTTAIVESLDAGADDYLVKPFDPQELLARVRTHLRNKDLYDCLQEANTKLKELVEIDDLTGLFNMRSTFSRLDQELERARRYQRQVAVVMMDMDYFKTVNDGHNHLFGSYVLSETGRLIRNTVRPNDIAARYGGDEFLIVLTEVNEEGARAFCERLRREISSVLFKSGRDQIRLTASLGFAITNVGQEGVDPKGLVKAADAALYQAKRDGRNLVRQYPMQEKKRKSLRPVRTASARKKAG